MESNVSTEKLVEDLYAVMRDAEALLQATASQTGEKIDGIRARASESLRRARERVAEAQAVKEVRDAARVADEYVHRNPWQSVGLGVFVGMLLGLLIGRR